VRWDEDPQVTEESLVFMLLTIVTFMPQLRNSA